MKRGWNVDTNEEASLSFPGHSTTYEKPMHSISLRNKIMSGFMNERDMSSEDHVEITISQETKPIEQTSWGVET